MLFTTHLPYAGQKLCCLPALPVFPAQPCTGSSTGACEAIVLLEPLPALLACVRRLAASCRQQQQQAEEEQAAAGMGMGLGDDGEGQEGAARRLPGVLLDGDGEGGGAGGAGPEVVELDLEAMEDEQAPAKVGGGGRGRRGASGCGWDGQVCLRLDARAAVL